ncbi:MAG TPA: peptidoglycan DD-metalloendopeptidase family protein [Candidatus Hydrogenedentes bacterium]|nr:peptidoglycan DD-metalloendopeptidase family protein [Candidatus Hydrogenedentota bacterium]HPG65605.1 peptidoglycan DD-metalloendopeptidase family protein [Candidatus Hydrogenedentota bacterium]
MKRWTVMLIPHDRGETRNVNLAAYQLWTVAILVVVLTFSTTFLLRRSHMLGLEAENLRQEVVARARAEANRPVFAEQAPAESVNQEELDRIRAEYEGSVAAITAELAELYEVEAEARDMTGLVPRKPTSVEPLGDADSGKGGGPGSLDSSVHAQSAVMNRPPQLIYGLSRPSADLIVQEIRLRKSSLRSFVQDLNAKRDLIERTPSIWPTRSSNRRITSRFGYRKDPFSRRVRHHDGTDISATYGSPVLATARGLVLFADWDKYLGQVVKIDHGDGVETWYGHLKSCKVKRGDPVQRGDVIGELGNTGRSTGAHIHYEVHVNGKPVDSGKYLRE